MNRKLNVRAAIAKLDPALVDFYDSMDPTEKQWVERFIRESVHDGKSISLDYIRQLDYERPVVTMRQFLEDPRFMGGIEVWPRWKEEHLYIADPKNQVTEVILGGGIGVGKTFNAILLMLYKLYQISCLRHPAEYYGLSKNSPIVFGIYNSTLKLTDVGVDTMLGMLSGCPYFKEEFPYREHYSEFLFPKNIKIMVGSQSFHVLGHNLMCLMIDEMNFHAQTKKQARSKKIEDKGKIHDLVQQTSRRVESRFAGAGLIIHISSTKTSHSYLELRKREVEGKRGIRVIEGPQWEFQPSKGRRDSGKTFRFCVGNKFTAPYCIDTVVNKGFGNFEVIPGAAPRRGLRVIDVPVEDYRAFDEDPIGSLRDKAGIATEALNPFFPRGEPIRQASVPHDVLPHPFVSGMGSRWDAPLFLDLDREERLEDFVLRDELLTIRSSQDVPKHHPHSPRYIHIDLARNGDALGMAMSHPTKAVSRKIRMDDGTYDDRVEVTMALDFALQIRGETNEVDWEKVRGFILWLKEKNFLIRKVTYDSPASGGEIQYLKKSRINAEYLTLDRKTDQYYTFKTALNEHRVSWPANEVLEDELAALELTVDDKVDHPAGGSKDVADAVCGAVWNCLQDDRVATMITPVGDESITHQDRVLRKVHEMMQNGDRTRG